MKLLPLLPLLLCCALSDPTCAATPQNPLKVAGLVEPSGLATAWESLITQAWAAIRHDQTANEVTLLFVHTTLDTSASAPDCAAGVIQTYPFLIQPAAEWVASAAVPSSFSGEVLNEAMPLGVPPWRMLAHLQQFLGDTEAWDSEYGAHNNTTGTVETRVGPFAFPSGLPVRDERHAWEAATWAPATGPIGGQVLDVVHLGRAAVMQAAHCYAHQNPLLPPLDQRALDGLNSFLDSNFGFEIHIQPVHVTLAPEPIRLRFDQRCIMRRRSLFEGVEDGWWMRKGPERWMPSLLNADINVYVGGRGEEMHILFPHPVTDLRALVMTTTGLVELEQILVFDEFNNRLRPEIGVFECPVNAVPGTVYFYLPPPEGSTPVAVPPVKPFESGAFLSPFTMPVQPPT